MKNKNKFYELLLIGPTKKFLAKKCKTMDSETMIVTPEYARHILKFYNKNNRRPSAVHVDRLSSDMLNGDWVQSGQTITFDTTGNLLDGQHRLLAIISTGIQQEFLMVYGLEREAFAAINNGLPLTGAKILEMDGFGENSATINALARSAIIYEANGSIDSNSKKGFHGLNKITATQTRHFLSANPNIVNYVDRYKKVQVVPQSVSSFCYWLLSSIDQPKAEEYLDQIFLGVGLNPNSLEYYLFNKFQRSRNAVQNKMSKQTMIANAILGWRRYMGYSHSNSKQISWDARKGIPKPN